MSARVDQQRQIRALATRAVDELWRIRPADLLDLKMLLLEEVPPLVTTFGEVAAVTAADHFEDITGRLAVLADPAKPEAVQASTRWALDPMFAAAPDDAATLSRLVGVVDYNVLQQGDDTMFRSSERHGTRWAWVPSHRGTCGFCLLKASRGAVYRTEATAQRALNSRHPNCNCTAEPVATDDDLARLKADGYDPDAAYQIYSEAARNVGTRDVGRLAAEIGRLAG